MREPRQKTCAERMENAKVRVGRFAGPRFGRVTRAQLHALGIEDSRITRWSRDGYLFPELPRVYAVGHPGRTEHSDLFAAVLYAGPGAALRGLTAAAWRGLVKWRTPAAIEVATPRRCASLTAMADRNELGRAIAVRGRQRFGRLPYHRIPTVPIPIIVRDLAETGDLLLVRIVLSQLDFMRRLNRAELEVACGRGALGSAVVHEALQRPQALFARARSPLEIRLVVLCEETGIPLPDEINAKLGGFTVDAPWRDQMVIVECDGEGNHATWDQRKRDLERDQALRLLGYVVIRYSSEQLNRPWAVYRDLAPLLRTRLGFATRWVPDAA